MAETLNSRIKSLRKEKAMTQLELAGKLNITDKAVSKWESGDGNPDITLLAKLAEIFGVTIDYLLTGKVEEIISLDDMDQEKKALYLIKKDDLINFTKYGCDDDYILFDLTSKKNIFSRRINKKSLEAKREAIISNRSYKIFGALLEKFITFVAKNNDCKRYQKTQFSEACFVKDYLDDFVLMCAALGRIDILELIKFKWFRIGTPKKDSNEFEPYAISEETLKKLLDVKETKRDVVDYICDPAFLLVLNKPDMFGRNIQIPTTGAQINYLLLHLYKKQDETRVKTIVDRLYKNLKENGSAYAGYNISNDIRGGYYNAKKSYQAGLCYSSKSYNGIAYPKYFAFVPLIDSALKEAEASLDVNSVILFNDYNKEVGKMLKIEVSYLSDEDIDTLRTKADPKANKYEVTISEFTRMGLIAFRNVIGSINVIKEVPSLKKSIGEAKDLYENVIIKGSISYMELIYKCLENNDFKSLFKFASDYQLDDFEDIILSNDIQKIKDYARLSFGFSKVELDAYNKNVESIQRCNDKINRFKTYRTYSASNQQYDEIQKLEAKNMAIICGSMKPNGKRIEKLLVRQLEVLGFDSIIRLNLSEDVVAECEALKKEDLDNYVNKVEELIESITKEKAMKAEYDKVTSEITFDFIKEEVAKGNLDNATIKLCVLLEGILKYRYRYEGDLFSMIDTFMKNHLQLHEMINPYDDEDNSYYSNLETDRKNAEDNIRIGNTKNLLHKLRMRRNNLVHSSNSNVAFTDDDLLRCIEIVEKL